MFEDWLAHVVVAASLSGGLFESFMSVRAQTADVWLGFFSSELLTFGICSLPLLLLLSEEVAYLSSRARPVALWHAKVHQD